MVLATGSLPATIPFCGVGAGLLMEDDEGAGARIAGDDLDVEGGDAARIDGFAAKLVVLLKTSATASPTCNNIRAKRIQRPFLDAAGLSYFLVMSINANFLTTGYAVQ